MRQKTVLSFVFGTTVLVLVNWFWVLRTSIEMPVGKLSTYTGGASQLDFTLQQLSKECENQIRLLVQMCTAQIQPFASIKFLSTDGKEKPEHTTPAAPNPSHRKFLTIGIPTVERKKVNYLIQTLGSLIERSTPDEKKNTTIVVMLADSDPEVRQRRAKEIQIKYQTHMESGFLQIVSPPSNIYPSLKNLRRTYNDSEQRVRWRVKQVLDFAFVFNYSSSLSEHFLILEDDILAASHYITAIRDFVATQHRDWVSLTFSGFLIIGRLLKSQDLPRLVNFLTMFHVEKPVDLLILQFIDLLVPDNRAVTRRVPSIFQHVGVHSSLDGKLQKLKDKSFVDGTKQFGLQNPFADILTTMEMYGNFYPELAYSSAYGFFWAKSPKANDTFDVVFQQPQKIYRIYIKTGSASRKEDILVNGVLEVSRRFVSMTAPNKAACDNFTVLTGFRNGIADAKNITLDTVQCLRLRSLEKQKHWLILFEIAIFTNQEH